MDHQRPVLLLRPSVLSHLVREIRKVHISSELLVFAHIECHSAREDTLVLRLEINTEYFVTFFHRYFETLLIKGHYTVVCQRFKGKTKVEDISVNSFESETGLVNEEIISDCLHLDRCSVELLLTGLPLGLFSDGPGVGLDVAARTCIFKHLVRVHLLRRLNYAAAVLLLLELLQFFKGVVVLR